MIHPLKYFPTPYPDECFYSILCRYYAHSCDLSSGITLHKLFDRHVDSRVLILLPWHISVMDEWFADESSFTKTDMAIEHTCMSYFSINFNPMVSSSLKLVLSGKPPHYGVDKALAAIAGKNLPAYLRFCPICLRKDIKAYGEPYWHRVHQLPHVYYCPVHGARLLDSPVSLSRRSELLFPATRKLLNIPAAANDSLSTLYSRFLGLAQDTACILENADKMSCYASHVHEVYRQIYLGMLFHDGHATSCLRLSHCRLLEDRFIQFHSQHFLHFLGFMLDEDWGITLYKATTIDFLGWLSPLIHILLMEFTEGGVKNFFIKHIVNNTQ